MSNIDLTEYVTNNELPTDPAILEELLNSWGKDKAEHVEAEKSEDVAADIAKSVVDKEVEAEPEGILSKDGKHVIPYDALKSERQARQEYQNENANLKAYIAQQEELAKNGVRTQQSDSIFKGLSAEKLEELKEYFPEEYEQFLSNQQAFEDTNHQLNEANRRLYEIQQNEASRQKFEQDKADLTTQELIDNNPILSHWQRNNPEAYEHCVKLDAIAVNNPINDKLTMEQRLDKVVKQALFDYENPFPEQVAKPAAKPAATKKADEKPPISSLSAFKGGEATEGSLDERMSSLTTAQISAEMMKMSAKEQDIFLTKIALNN